VTSLAFGWRKIVDKTAASLIIPRGRFTRDRLPTQSWL